MSHMCPSIPGGNFYGFDPDTWNAAAYTALSVASRVSTSLKSHAMTLGLARDIWKLDSLLRDFLEQVYKSAETPSASTTGRMTKEQAAQTAEILRKVHADTEQLYERARSNGLTNRTLVGAAFNSVKVRAEEILDLSDALSVCLDSDVDALLDRAIEDLRRGNVHDLPALK